MNAAKTQINSHKLMKLYSIVAILAFCCVTFIRAQETTLSVEETLGAVFFTTHEGEDAGSVFRAANPAAKPKLYELLSNEELNNFHSNIYLILGYIGNGNDAKRMELHLKNNFTGNLTPSEVASIQTIFFSLSAMANRGVPEALEVLERMTSLEYWKHMPFKWPNDGTTLGHGTANELTIWALLAYARSGKEDWREKLHKFKREVRDEKALQTIQWRLDPDRVEQHLKEFRLQRGKPISPETRNVLSGLFNRHFKSAGNSQVEPRGSLPAPRPVSIPSKMLPASEVSALQPDALKAFNKAKQNIKESNYEGLVKCIADNGKPILPLEKQDEGSIKAAAEKLKAISKDLEASKALLQDLDDRVIRYGEARGEKLSDGIIIVTIPCLASELVKKKHLRHHSNSRTTGPNDELIIYMIQQNGQWYWNPFGW